MYEMHENIPINENLFAFLHKKTSSMMKNHHTTSPIPTSFVQFDRPLIPLLTSQHEMVHTC